ncbi:TPA: hypothetical protein ACU9NN_004452 [Enterobacter asburiae]
MAKKPRYFHTAVHKNITRDRFIRSVNPIVAEKMRAILEELKRKESGRGYRNKFYSSWHSNP